MGLEPHRDPADTKRLLQRAVLHPVPARPRPVHSQVVSAPASWLAGRAVQRWGPRLGSPTTTTQLYAHAQPSPALWPATSTPYPKPLIPHLATQVWHPALVQGRVPRWLDACGTVLYPKRPATRRPSLPLVWHRMLLGHQGAVQAVWTQGMQRVHVHLVSGGGVACGSANSACRPCHSCTLPNPAIAAPPCSMRLSCCGAGGEPHPGATTLAMRERRWWQRTDTAAAHSALAAMATSSCARCACMGGH